ncbi:MAG TPA: hypothetical protein VFH39_01910 [Candidatus Saccharimonadales bacterium]|nr:hypothetical protein [Candidatus Saccharimonadales bacterium]
MSPEVIIVGLMAVPVVLLFALQVNAALVFLSLCLGDVLVQFAGHDASSIISGAAVNAHATTSSIQLALLLAPAVLTVLFMIKTVHGKYKKIFNILPAAGVGLLTALLAVPLLPPGLSHNVTAASLWQNILQFQSGIMALSTLVCLLFLWMQRPKKPGEDKHGKHPH